MANNHYSISDRKEWAAMGFDDILARHEPEYCNQYEDGCDSLAGECWVADDDTRTIIVGSFGNDHSPFTMAAWAEVYDTEEEYRAAVAEWEAKDEYLPSDEETVECIACGDDFDRDDVSETGAGDYICDECHEKEQEEEERRKWEDDNTPTEGDLWTDDNVNFWIVSATGSKELAFRVEPNRSVREAFDAWCEENQFWPNVWVAEERGGFHLYDWSNEVPF